MAGRAEHPLRNGSGSNQAVASIVLTSVIVAYRMTQATLQEPKRTLANVAESYSPEELEG